MLRIRNLQMPLGCTDDMLRRACERALGSRVGAIRVVKKSVDARNRDRVHFLFTVDAEGALARPNPDVSPAPKDEILPPPPRVCSEDRPVVVGLGPAGLFCAYQLARAGLRPVVLERGKRVDERARDVSAFRDGGALDPESNVQFGEGGAGAFSDGKLNTGISDPRCRAVLRTLYECGAPEEILYEAKPHVGTDRLPGAVKNLRERIVALGGEVRFQTRLEDICVEDGRIAAVRSRGPEGGFELPARCVVLAIGHSARDTFESLLSAGVPMERKPFSIGARVEHLQRAIDARQYGPAAGHPALGAADYKLSCKLPNGRSAYTFCMCPGGTVVAAASEAGFVATNGMSVFARDGVNANAALLVGVEPSDFGGDDPLAGVRFQRLWEKRAFELGGGDYRAPAQRMEDFLIGRASKGAGGVLPTYQPGVTYADLAQCLPAFAVETMREAAKRFDRQLAGYAAPDALLTGVETRSSSPLRMPRGENGQSAIEGLYPCGEGAGYAGGILSAAVDGLRTADRIIQNFAPH